MIALCLWLAALGHANEPLIDGLEAELQRSTEELEIGDAGAPYFVGYDLFDTWSTSVTATLGGVVGRGSAPDRELGVAVRVGSAELDNANFADNYRGDGFRSRNAVLGDDPLALRHTAWLATDRAYKEAVENLARRRAARARRATNTEADCFGPGEPQVSEAPAEAAVPVDALEPIAVQLSKVFADYPQIEWSRVFAGAESGRRALVDSLGTRVVKPEAEVNVRAIARVRAEDGSWITDHASWTVRTVDDLPPIAQMEREVRATADRLVAWRALPATEDDYVGPALFEGDAAVELVRSLLIPTLSGTPPEEEPPAGSRVISFGDTSSDTVRVKRRLLPDGFHVRDDPTADLTLPSGYRYDDEGEKAQAIDLVVDGVIRSHYGSRTPSKEVPVSNGHGRGNAGDLKRGAPAQTSVRAEKTARDRKMHKMALSQAEAYQLDHYVVIRRIEDPAAARAANPVMISFGGSDSPVRPPLVAVKVYADGREEPVRGWTFVGLDHRALRDVVVAGATVHERTLLVPPPGEGARGATYGLPTTLSTPDLLLSEVELASGGGSGEKPPALPSPLAAD